MLLRRTCKAVTVLVIAREDRVLPITDRIALQLHMAVCKTCPAIERQVLTMRQVIHRWRNYVDEQ